MCKECDGIGMIPFLEEEVTVTVNPMKAATTVLAVGGGFGGSNLATANINRQLVKNGKEAWNPVNTGLAKIGLGAITILATLQYAPTEFALEGVAFGAGMAASGGLDIAKDKTPATASQAVKDLLGINGINGAPVIDLSLPQGNRAATGNGGQILSLKRLAMDRYAS